MFYGPTITYDLDYGTYYGQYGVIENPRVGYMRDGVFLGASFGWKGHGSGVGLVAAIFVGLLGFKWIVDE